jgi:hypothetical protein
MALPFGCVVAEITDSVDVDSSSSLTRLRVIRIGLGRFGIDPERWPPFGVSESTGELLVDVRGHPGHSARVGLFALDPPQAAPAPVAICFLSHRLIERSGDRFGTTDSDKVLGITANVRIYPDGQPWLSVAHAQIVLLVWSLRSAQPSRLFAERTVGHGGYTSKACLRLPPMIHRWSGSLEKLGCGHSYPGATVLRSSRAKRESSMSEMPKASDHQWREINSRASSTTWGYAAAAMVG